MTSPPTLKLTIFWTTPTKALQYRKVQAFFDRENNPGMAKPSSRIITPKNKTLTMYPIPKNGRPVTIPPTSPRGAKNAPIPSKAKTPGIPITTPIMAKYGANLTIISFHPFGIDGAFFSKYSSKVTSNFPNIDPKSAPSVVVLAIIILKIYNINPAIIIKAGTIYIIDLIVPVTGKLTIAVGDADTLAMIISVGVAVAVGEIVSVGDRFICSVGSSVNVCIDDKTKVGVGVSDGVGVGVLVAVGVQVGRGAVAFCCVVIKVLL